MSKVEFVDADAHVVEAEMIGECLERWPMSFTLPADGSIGVITEGRRYPEPTGPGAGCPPEHGLSKAEGISQPRRSARQCGPGRYRPMVFFPSFGLRSPVSRIAGWPSALRVYNEWIAGWRRRGVRSRVAVADRASRTRSRC
jgi:hypothetical protein